MDAQLGASNDIWKVCNWHKNQRGYQIGDKFNEVGYEVYDTCRRHGAIVSTGPDDGSIRRATDVVVSSFQATSTRMRARI